MDNLKKNREFVSLLIKKVLSNEMTVLEAVSIFPKEKDDISIKCAFDALMHREADEDLRKNIEGYSQIQDDFLSDLAVILSKNQPLPKNIIMQYYKFHEDDLISDDKFDFLSFLKKVKRMINF
ncbi:MAG: hypothetical protein IJD57_00930 [Candidatus Gastranaerophilales bacterium]|nr:hypothetical protein [Candidatus Gastranaerophilales bacterium]